MEYLVGLALVFLVLTVVVILWYVIVAWSLISCCHKSSTFILLTSQAFNDIYALSQSAWHFANLIAGVKQDTVHFPRWFSIIHGSFELISLPHYLVIALNRAMFLVDYSGMAHCFRFDRTIWLCVTMWVVPVIVNIVLHQYEGPENGGYYIFEADGLGMGTETTAFQYKSIISVVFEYSFMATALMVTIIYILAIIAHGWHRRQIAVPENTMYNPNSTNNRGMRNEMRLTFVCLVNLVPPTLTTIMNFAWTEGTANMEVYAFLTILDNSINSFVLPMFSRVQREHLLRKLIICKEARRKFAPPTVIHLNSNVATS